MCYEFDEMYRKAREADEARKKSADALRNKSSAPAKPASPDKSVREKEPVPA